MYGFFLWNYICEGYKVIRTKCLTYKLSKIPSLQNCNCNFANKMNTLWTLLLQ